MAGAGHRAGLDRAGVANGGLRYLPCLVQGPCPQICSAKGVPARPLIGGPPVQPSPGLQQHRRRAGHRGHWIAAQGRPWPPAAAPGQHRACLAPACPSHRPDSSASTSKQPARPSLAQGIGLGLIVQAWQMVGFGVCLAWCRVRALSFAARRVFLPAPLIGGPPVQASPGLKDSTKRRAGHRGHWITPPARTAAPAQASKGRAPWALQTASKVKGEDFRGDPVAA